MSKIKAQIIEIQNDKIVLKHCDHITSLRNGLLYNVEFKPYKASRSVGQNNKLWALIQELSEITLNDPNDIYIAALENANIKYETIFAIEQAIDNLRLVYRAVKPYGTITTDDNKQLVEYRCWLGSSKYNTEEMCKLIDFVEREIYATTRNDFC